LAKRIIDISGSNSTIIYQKLPTDDPKQRRPDITLAKKELNWAPKVEIEEGLTKTIEYFDNLLRNDPRI
jgi:UDP-glucuronate decarboxylase